jgi:hypothetical protein
MPKKGEIINACTLPLHYLDLMVREIEYNSGRKGICRMGLAPRGSLFEVAASSATTWASW